MVQTLWERKKVKLLDHYDIPYLWNMKNKVILNTVEKIELGKLINGESAWVCCSEHTFQASEKFAFYFGHEVYEMNTNDVLFPSVDRAIRRLLFEDWDFTYFGDSFCYGSGMAHRFATAMNKIN